MTFDEWKSQMVSLGELELTSHTRGRCVPYKSHKGIAKSYYNKIDSSKEKDIIMELSFDDYLMLCYDANIMARTQIGRTKGKLQLGRLGDVGSYSYNNCRFITVEQNLVEREHNGGNENISKKMTGKNNPSFKGIWHTPYGKFDTCVAASINSGYGESTVRRRCHDSARYPEWYLLEVK